MNIWEGVYKDFSEAKTHRKGVGFEGDKWLTSATDVLETCLGSLASGEPIPNKIKQRYDLVLSALAHMLAIYETEDEETEEYKSSKKFKIIDFGGGLASFFFCACEVIPQFAARVEYHVVENKAVHDLASQSRKLKNYNITFHEKIPSIKPDFVIAISSLQYIECWQDIISQMVALQSPYVFFGDVFLGEVSTFASIQNYYGSKIPCWFINEREFRQVIQDNKLRVIYEALSFGDRLGEKNYLPMDNFPEKYQMPIPKHFLLSSKG